MDRSEVEAAFDVLLEEIELAIEAIKDEGDQAFRSGQYQAARDLSEKGLQISTFRNKVRDLKQEWLRTFATVMPQTVARTRQVGQTTEWSQRGRKTPRRAFRLPILQALVELGGAAPLASALERVEAAMRDQLNKYDYQRLSADPSQTSWSKSVQWERYEMVREGLLAKDSRRGIWKITPAGRAYLAEASERGET